VPLLYLFPDADVPVVQVSLPRTLDGDAALKLGQALAPLADEGGFIVGSGSITHNVYEVFRETPQDVQYAQEFVEWARAAVRHHDGQALANYLQSAPHARRAHPTPDHYLPLPFAFGAAKPDAPVRVLDGGMTFNILAMDAYVFGA
jgi:4,5-DOPA dioxygenase extradiol